MFPEAQKLGAAVVFQAVPTQLAVAIARIHGDYLGMEGQMVDPQSGYTVGSGINRFAYPKCGFIVSVPGSRPAGAILEQAYYAEEIAPVMEAIKFVNPRAKCTYEGTKLTLVVDPPTPFVFSHIEWL